MNEIPFRQWLNKKGVSRKLQSDHVSRLKRVERAINYCDIDDEYYRDRCASLMSFFFNLGKNDNMKFINITNLPIGKTYMNTYRYSINRYVDFMDSQINL